MNIFRPSTISVYRTAFSLAAALTMVAPLVKADAWDKQTTVSFSQPIEVPGAVLPAGKYVMKLVDSPSDRHVVQFSNARGNHVFAAVMAIPTYRERATDRTVITFYETPRDRPEAIRYWYYPGDNAGQEFVYPKGRKTLLAAYTPPVSSEASLNRSNYASGSPVVTAEPAAQTNEATPAAAGADPAEIAQATPPKSDVEPVTVAQNPSSTAETPATSTPPADTALPKTAGDLAEVGLLGLLSLAGGAAVRKFRGRLS